MEMETGKLFIGGISWDTNEESLKEYFQTFGEVIEAVIMKDRATGRARGFGFVVFADAAIAERVVKAKHMIDGRTVEAKKAVPRDDQQTPTRTGGSFQGSPVSVGRNVYPPFSPGYGIGPNLEPDFGANFEGAGHVSNISYGRGPNPLHGSPNRYGSAVGNGSAVGYGIGSSGYGISSNTRNSLGNGSVTYAKSPTNSGSFAGTGVGNTGLLNAFGNIEAIWGSPPISGQTGGMASALSSGNSNFGSADSSFELGAVGYARNTSSNIAPTSSLYAAAASSNEGDFGNFRGGGLFYGDPAWRSSSPELDGFGLFDGLRNAVSNVTPRDAALYAEGYSVNNRSTRGIAA
ncbi:Heterogeneous nuclear ribonucleoprotein 1 [Heracleum sosnowskyi]|uniref:Heterogeneous nuclear ribonucleoprotein 1 n=1 Tax=Heracleum sosnowskyi TaxID=360622 RepID=A0AAD8JG53_9APIA|nr:Heterogeneous nuclear ribonucleoprotein 1 [Heracleum sosnowskyi]